jgi:amino acid adenylation domain-containing protein
MVSANTLSRNQTALSESRRRLLQAMIDGAKQGADQSSPYSALTASPGDRYKPFSVTDLQSAYLTGRQGDFALGNVATHVYLEFESEGLDLERLNAAWQKLIERHDTLRIVFPDQHQEKVLESVDPYVFATLDLRRKAPMEVEEALLDLRARMSHQVRPAGEWPLFEICSAWLDGARLRVFFSIDGLITDARSILILLEEWSALYADPSAKLRPIEIGFRDYVLAEQQFRKSPEYGQSLEYWRARLKDLPPAPELPLMVDPESIRRPRFLRQTRVIDASVWQELKKRASGIGLTGNSIALAAYAEVLSRWSNSTHFTINVPSFNRLPFHPQVNHIVGEFASFVLLEVNQSSQVSFQERAQSLQRQLWADVEQYASGITLLRELARLQPARAGKGMPIVFTSTLGMDVEESALFATPANVVYGITQTPQVWLDNQIHEEKRGLVIEWDAVEGIFPPSLVEDMLSSYASLLARLAVDGALWTSCGNLASLPADQRARRRAVNSGVWQIPETTCQELFDFQATEHPESPALITEETTLTYCELRRRSIQLGIRLRERGARPNTLVAIVMEKGWEQIVSVLGTLYSGAAYVPIDATIPRDRMWRLLAHCEVTHVLTQSWLESRFEWPPGIELLAVDGIRWNRDPAEPLARAQSPDDVAYVIFTSGSTGTPKGVAVAHRGIVNAITYTNREFGIGRQDRVLALTALHHDMSVYDTIGVLAAGGALVIPRADLVREPAHWWELIHRHRVTLWNSVPAFMEMLAEHLETASQAEVSCRPQLRLAFLGGDWIPLTLPERMQAYQPGLGVVSVGGPTETTLWNIWYQVDAVDRGWKSIPYGKPIANTRYYILSETLEDCPDWVRGEMYCAGVGVALGYWHDEEKSTSVFIQHPRTGERLYKTGDLGRYLPDGNIEFMGRNDFQVKILGQRIELGEIEAALRKHPLVQAAVVIAQGDIHARKRLIAYVVAPEQVTTEELRGFLAETLPAHFVPAVFVCLKELPRSSNGKLDRRALPPLDGAEAKTSVSDRPSTEYEILLAGIWESVFPGKSVLADDNFFELGGDSISAIQVVSRLRNAVSGDVPVAAVFQYPVLRELAAHLAAGFALRQGTCSLPVIERQGALPLSFTQQRLWFLHQLQPSNPAYNMSYGVHLQGSPDSEPLAASLNQIVTRHEVLRTAFTEQAGRPQAILYSQVEINLSTEDLTQLDESAREDRFQTLVQNCADYQFDLQTPPLLRALLVKLRPDRSVLLLTVHHIVCDGWSLGILIRELAELYNAKATGKIAHLALLPVQYLDYVAWQRSTLQGDVLRRHLQFWTSEPGPIPLLDLPTDYPRPQVQDYRGSRASVQVQPDLVQALKQLSNATSSTLTMTLLAAFNILLSRLTGQTDVITGLVTANRSLPEIEPLIGCFLNALPLRVRLDESRTFLETLDQVRKSALGVYEHQDLPFEKLIEVLQPERNLDRNPVFEILFNTINVPLAELQLEGVRVCSIEDTQTRSKYALTVYINEWNDGLEIRIVYQTALFSQQRINLILDQLQTLLRQVSSDPNRPIARYSLATPDTLRLLPDPAIRLEEPAMPNVVDLLRASVEASPESTAIVREDKLWSYRELWDRSLDIAAYLATSGVKPGNVVAVLGLRNFGVIAAMFAVWRAGGVLLLLDWNLPPGRHQTMLKEAAAKTIIYVGARRDEDAWMTDFSGSIISLDADSARPVSSAIAGAPIDPLSLAPGQPAYVFFTSGTTGAPKGVKGLHKGLGHFLTWQRDVFHIGPSDRCAQLTNLSFDVVLRDICMPLISGATLLIPGARDEADGASLVRWMRERRITVFHAVPTLLESWLSDLSSAATVPSMRWIFFAGEPLPDKLVVRCRDLCSEGVGIVNLYGPTETTLAKCAYTVPQAFPSGMQPVGYPMPNTQALVLNSTGDVLCGVGELGEIWIRTPFRTEGYINPELGSASVFRPNPFAPNDGVALYPTGDLGRYGLDGALRIAGRRDQQVKIQGVRVEPNEVKAALNRHPAVESCAVVPWRDEEGKLALVGFVTFYPNQRVTNHALRAYVGRELPAAMVPSRFVYLKSLPRTANGKVDHRALPFPRKKVAVAGVASVARTGLERKLIEIWSEALGLQAMGIDDNFFELGGHSMLAAQVVARVRDEFKVQLPLCRLFEAPTVASIARQIELAQRLQAGHPSTPVITNGKGNHGSD